MILPVVLRGQDSVTWKHASGTGLYGPTYATSTISNVRVVRKTKTIRRQNADDIVSTAFFACAEAVEPRDMITLDGVDHPVLQVDAIPDGSGVARFREVYL